MRAYICDVIGSGTEIDPFRPAAIDGLGIKWTAVDGRSDATSGDGVMMIECDPTPAQHTEITSSGQVEYVGEY